MNDTDGRYRVTIYVAAPGTPLALSSGTSAAGHMYYSVFDGAKTQSFGFAPIEHGVSKGLGSVHRTDVMDYQDPYYARTLEISRSQYEKLIEFGNSPEKFGFDMQYNGATNSCIDFTWGALNHAGLHRKTWLGIGDKSFEGDLKPLQNVDDIQRITAPFPDSDLNREQRHPMPERTWLQKAISAVETPGAHALAAGTSLGEAQDPLHLQAEAAVRRLEQGLGRDYDGDSARLAASTACLAKERRLSRIDHVVLSCDTGTVRQGENVFVVQGALNDPAHLRAHMRTEEALSRPVEQSLAQLQALNDSQRQQTPQVEPHEQAHHPRMG